VNGIGQKKLEEYGEMFLGIVEAFLHDNPDAKS
jgi:hypothetical protein